MSQTTTITHLLDLAEAAVGVVEFKAVTEDANVGLDVNVEDKVAEVKSVTLDTLGGKTAVHPVTFAEVLLLVWMK